MSHSIKQEIEKQLTSLVNNPDGLLNAEQSDKFISYLVDQSVILKTARTVRLKQSQSEINKIGVGKRVTVPREEGKNPLFRASTNNSKITLNLKPVVTPFEISDDYVFDNIEGNSVEDTIVKLMAMQMVNDIESQAINGNKLGTAVTPYGLFGKGSTTQYFKDPLNSLWDGFLVQANAGNVINFSNASLSSSIFSKMIKAMPNAFKNRYNDLVFVMSANQYQTYLEKLSDKSTALGDQITVNGGSIKAFGINILPVWQHQDNPLTVEHIVLTGTNAVSLRSSNIDNIVVTPTDLQSDMLTNPYVVTTDYVVDKTAGTIARVGAGAIADGATVKVTYESNGQILLTTKSNLVVAVSKEDIRIEKAREIYQGVNQYAISARFDFKFEEIDAVVKAINVKPELT